MIEKNGGETFVSLRCFSCEVLVRCSTDCTIAGDVGMVLVLEPGKSMDLRFMYVGQVELPLRGDDQVLAWFSSLRVDDDVVTINMHVMCGFLMFLPGSCDLSSGREVGSTRRYHWSELVRVQLSSY